MFGRNGRRQRGGAWILVLCAAVLAGAASPAFAQVDPPGRVGRVAVRQGDVWILDADSSEWVAAALNRPFTQGERLATGADGSATLRIGSTALIMDRDTTIDAVRLDDDRVQIALEQGSVALQVLSADIAAETELSTAEGRFEPLRAGLYRVDRQGQTSWGSVWRGELALTAPDLRLTLQPGERADLWLDTNRGLTHSRPLAPLNDDFAATVWRDTEAVAGAGAGAPVYVSPEMTGADDLGRYGGWQQHPQFGPVWAPTVVAAGWAPYRFGQWVWLRPWGWTWVDDAPWGFAPFHYGRWLWWGGRWFWAPGPWMPRPVFAPALVGWFGGPQLRVVIGARPLPAVGWLPLAPHERYRPPFAAGPAYLNRVNAGPPGYGGRPPGYANRQVPGAVTVLPGAAPVPRQPVAGAAVDGREVDWRRRLPRDDFYRPPPPALPAAPQAIAREPVQWPARRPVPPAMPAMPARPVTQPPLPQVPVQPPPRPHPGPTMQSPQPMQPMQPMQPPQPMQPAQPAPAQPVPPQRPRPHPGPTMQSPQPMPAAPAAPMPSMQPGQPLQPPQAMRPPAPVPAPQPMPSMRPPPSHQPHPSADVPAAPVASPGPPVRPGGPFGGPARGPAPPLQTNGPPSTNPQPVIVPRPPAPGQPEPGAGPRRGDDDARRRPPEARGPQREAQR